MTAAESFDYVVVGAGAGGGVLAARLAEAMKNNEHAGQLASYDPLTIRGVAYWYPFAREQDAKRFAAGLAKAGVPD